MLAVVLRVLLEGHLYLSRSLLEGHIGVVFLNSKASRDRSSSGNNFGLSFGISDCVCQLLVHISDLDVISASSSAYLVS